MSMLARRSIAAAFVLMASTALAQELTTDQQKFSYAIGLQVAQNLKSQGMDVDAKALTLAIEDILGGLQPRLSMEELQGAVTAYQQELQKEKAEAAGVNKAEGEAFLAANKDKEGVTELPSGLQYKVMTEGSGKKPTASDSVIVHYRGTLLDGTEFDSSYKRGQPATLSLGQVIKAWQEALPLMQEGSKWEIYVPSELAYGERGAGGAIGPHSALIFEIELQGVE